MKLDWLLSSMEQVVAGVVKCGHARVRPTCSNAWGTCACHFEAGRHLQIAWSACIGHLRAPTVYVVYMVMMLKKTASGVRVLWRFVFWSCRWFWNWECWV